MTNPTRPAASRTRGRWLRAAWTVTLLAPLVLAVTVVAPDLLHYRVPTRSFDTATVRAIVEHEPTEATATLGRLYFFPRGFPASEIEKRAQLLLDRRFVYQDYAPVSLGRPLRRADLAQGPDEVQLELAGLEPARQLLDAYESTGQADYLAAARDLTLEMKRLEQSTWLSTGLLWNDHAVATRVVYATRLFFALRAAGKLTAQDAGELLTGIDRWVAMLARPDHFTARTNHGVMQNLAILHAASAFPALFDRDGRVELAIQRLDAQMKFYIGADGVVTEHSSGYHELGVHLGRLAEIYLRLLNRPVPASWHERLQRAEQVLVQFQRPDGSLPLIGDSRGAQDFPEENASYAAQAMRAPATPVWLSRDFGYAVWRRDAAPATHLTAFWADFASQAHKHADDLGFVFWSDDSEWWTTSGYWPYWEPNRRSGIGWPGSNAPHVAGEATFGPHRDRLVSSLASGPLRLIELERATDEGYVVNRQMVEIDDGTKPVWLVLDRPQDAKGRMTQSIWTVPAGVAVDSPAAARKTLSVPAAATHMDVDLLGSATTAQILRGSHSPFGGWISSNSQVVPTRALQIETPSGQWSGVVWRMAVSADAADGAATPALETADKDHWTLSLPSGVAVTRIVRKGLSISIERRAGSEELTLVAAPQLRPLLDEATAAYRSAAAAYPEYEGFLPWRLKVATAALLLAMAQLLAFLLMRWWRPNWLPILLPLATLGWLVLGVWLEAWYFQPHLG